MSLLSFVSEANEVSKIKKIVKKSFSENSEVVFGPSKKIIEVIFGSKFEKLSTGKNGFKKF